MAEISKEEYLALQRELEGLRLAIAKGEETDRTDARIAEIEQLMDASPWTLCPDEGCVRKIQGTEEAWETRQLGADERYARPVDTKTTAGVDEALRS